MRKVLFFICISYIKVSFAQDVTASFNAPDTVCVNSAVNIQNTSQQASSYYWSFCAADFNITPEAVNIGNPSGVLSSPVFGCYALDDNGNYYGLMINYNSGELLRLNFGNSLLNVPTGEDLGNFGNALPEQGEGIQLLRVNGDWIAVVVGGGNGSFNSSPRIVKIDFGNSLTNTPIATNWGNIGGLNLPHDFYISEESGNYYGFAINVNDNTITRINFGSDLNGTPTGVNLGNIGNINYPAGFTFIKYNGNWFAYIANRVTNSLTRLSFGSSLLNVPTGVNIGNPGGLLDYPRDISLFNTCNGIDGFVVNEMSNEIIQLNFGSDPSSSPQATNLGNLGNLDFPHSISDFFRVGNDIYAFIPNVITGTLTRIRFAGCQNVPGSTQQNPSAVFYPQPGTFNINLLVDLGLPTQTSYCKQIVVQNCNKTIINNYTPVLAFDICKNQITVADASKYNPGDTVLLIQMKGALIDSSNTSGFGNITNYRNAGNYEFNYIKQKTGNIIYLKNKVTRQYDIPDGKVQLIRVPYYNSFNISNTITCQPWDGSTGGVLAFNVKDTLTLNADLDVKGKGFRGGDGFHGNPSGYNCYQNDFSYPVKSDFAAGKGEGITSLSTSKSNGRGKQANGGGGGDSHNAGGGGGSNSGSGGYGGYQFEGGDCTATVPYDNRGFGGMALTYSNANNKIFLGGGGGAGHANNPELFFPNGGNGGGICIVTTNYIKGNNRNIYAGGDSGVACNGYGATGCHEGMGGGGGGGTILLKANNYISLLNTNSNGGNGADMVQTANLRVGPGGGGGGGICWLNNATILVNLNTNLLYGNNGVCTDYGNDPWGATPGKIGSNLFNLKIPVDTVLFKPNIDSARIKNSATSCNAFSFKGLGYTNTYGIASWQWYFGDGSTANTQNTSHSYPKAGTFTAKLIITDINGCQDSITKSVTTSILKDTISNDTTLCAKSSVQLFVNGGSTYSWSPVTSLNNPKISNPVANPLVTTTYYVKITNALGCTKMDSVKITVDSLPVISISNDTSICSNTSVELHAGGGSTYSWTPMATLNNPNVSNPIATPSATTTYFVKVSTAAGCFKNDSVKIIAKTLPVIRTSNDTSICTANSIQLLASGGSSYSWSPSSTLDNAAVNNPLATPLATTVYHVIVTNAIGCSNMDSVKIVVNGLPVITKSKDQGICNNASVQLFAGGGISYSWTPTPTLNNPGVYNPVASPSVSTIYYVMVTNANGCSKKDSVSITTSAPPVITKSADTAICKTSSTQISANGGSTYTWSPASTLSNAAISNPIASPNMSTTYFVTVTNADGCSKKDSVKVAIDPVPLITVSNDTTICNLASVTLFATGGSSYLWSPASSLNNPLSHNPVASPLSTTVYKVNIKDAYSCMYKDSVKVSVRSAAVFTVSPGVSVCEATSTQLSASGGDIYLWAPASGLNNPNISNPVATPTATTTYTVTIDESTCNQSAKLSTLVEALPLPVVRAVSTNDLTCSLSSSQLNATGATSYTWSPATGLSNSNIANPVATITSTTLYTVVGKGENGCFNSDTVTVKYDKNFNALYLLPNAFTPNGDGLNDCFGIKYWGTVNDLEFSIYNRYGERVFFTTDPNKCWDGTYKSQLQDVNVFVYIIKARTSCGYIERKGTVSLLK